MVVIAGLGFFGFFDENPSLSPLVQSAILSGGVFLVLPLLYCKMVLRRPLTALGFTAAPTFAGLGGSLVAVVSALIVLFALMQWTPLFEGYRLPLVVEKSFFVFVLYQVVLNGWITFLLEVFFRGLVLLVWLPRLGLLGVFAQAVLFGVFLWVNHSFSPQTIPLLIMSPLAGLIAYQTRSIYFSWGASWFFIFLADTITLIVH